jgi:2-polyprenyl-6-methoxyphenol hydroxylase-like FAD-dependent oxidoreductase
MQGKSVLIAGAGIAGPTLAYWLKRGGFEPVLVERAPELRSGGYVVDFWGLGYDIAAKMGLERAVNDAGYHARELRVVDDKGRRVTGFGIKIFNELTQGRFVTLARSELSRLIFDRTKDNVETIFGDEVMALSEDETGVTVRFAKNGTRRFDLVVGADGLHSGIRALAFGAQPRFEAFLGYQVAAFEIPGYRPRDPEIYLLHNKLGRMLGRFTLRDDRVLILFIFASEAAVPHGLSAQKALLKARFAGTGWESTAILEALEEAPELYLDRVSQIRMPRWSKGRVALLGDAAYCVSLAAGQGTALAMTGAYVLAGELLRATSHEDAFAAYESRLKDFMVRKQKGASRFAGAMAPRTPLGLWFRDAVIQAMELPGVTRYAVGRDIVDRLVLPDYEFPAADS